MGTMVLMTSERLGRDDEDLGRRLTIKFLHQLSSMPDKPSAVGFYNGAVRLLVASSPVLASLTALETAGVELIACGTCVDHFGLRDDVVVGRISDMREIVSTMMSSKKVVTV